MRHALWIACLGLVWCNSGIDSAVILSRADDEGSQVGTPVDLEILRCAQDDGLCWCHFDRYTPLVAAAALAATTTTPLPPGDAATGRETFVKLRCNICHSVAGQKPLAQLPLRDFSHETPEAVANVIVARMETAPEALFDEMAMSAAASEMTMRELADIVEYLRNPGAKH